MDYRIIWLQLLRKDESFSNALRIFPHLERTEVTLGNRLLAFFLLNWYQQITYHSYKQNAPVQSILWSE